MAHKRRKNFASPATKCDDCNLDLLQNGQEKGLLSYSSIRYKDLFGFATSSDIFLLSLGLFLSVVFGAAFPVSILVFRWVVNDITSTVGVSYVKIYRASVWIAVIAACAFLISFGQVWFTNICASRVVKRIRRLLIQAVLNQDVAWLDEHSVGSLIDKLTEHTTSIHLGIGEKLSEFIQNISSFFIGFFIAFAYGWKLSLVACSSLPLVLIGFSLFGTTVRRFSLMEQDAYSKSSTITEEVLSAIRTVINFSGERKEVLRYSNNLNMAAACGVKQAGWLGFAGGFVGMSIYTSSALVFWYGVTLIRQSEYDPGSVILVFLNIIIGSLFLGSALPNFRYFHVAKASARDIFDIIKRKPSVDKTSSNKRLDDFTGKITFNKVSFSYPSRHGKVILNNFSLTIQSNETTAFVGPSGCGKTTITQLIERFYDPDNGQILFDDTDLRALNVNWIRSNIGIVQQDPVLFTGTISENIRMGCLKDTLTNDDYNENNIIEAAKLAHAHEFITKLPEGYNTMISRTNSELSVGQKQRISIARALIRKPKILIFDEATSALDNHSERMIQCALENIKINRTVIIIAHRLSTIRNANKIVVLDNGRIREIGTHAQLSSTSGFYSAMLKLEIPDKVSPSINDNMTNLQADDIKFSNDNQLLLDDHTNNNLKSTNSCVNKNINEYQVNKISSMLRLLKLSKPEWKSITLGCIAAFITGGLQPIFAILYSEIYAIFSLVQKPDEMQIRANLVTGIIALLGLIRLASSTCQGYFLGVASQKLTKRLRQNLFSSMLKQEMAWHDKPENNPGILSFILTSDANKVNTFCGTSLGRLIESAVLVTFSLTIAFVYNWKLTLVVLFFSPVTILSSYLQLRQIHVNSDVNNETMAARIIHEALSSARTVYAYGLEDYFCKHYSTVLNLEMTAGNRTFIIYSFVYALAQSLPICSYAATFSYGAYLMSLEEINLIAIFKVFAAISFAAQALGRTSHVGPEMKHASLATNRIFKILDRDSKIPVDEGLCPDQSINNIPIEFRQVSYRYPSRPTSWVLKDFSWTFQPRQNTAIVGLSGSGKTSILCLIHRLYETDSSNTNSGIFLNDINIRMISPKWIREQICVVNQEPQLFNLTLMENIAYGNNAHPVTMDEITDAAQRANIHEFIMTLPQGYNTLAGPRGTHISTGQRQRIAIARALVRKPKLLLLDEITSAMDPENERYIQNLLTELSQDCTYLLVTHRLLSTTQVDQILFLSKGKIVESGSFDQLKQAKGAFYGLFCPEETEQT
ncbi:putative multidrug resistance protein 1, 2, 3 (p glycoprotein 1, 2, 3) [Schistosoma mansoni]|uniref:putative multidrug resistance protein 1, 2, 3 (p glycoprotein 1, 2, 3) n=1 Tax=Schistosoma mansoni TaxID=6183 RepID=UPI0001A64631|nr:putative multidrug resistance protein 1, 2, 3 (p glycoprotein 1, 2, 3) [Schistosoma mansoni]|eukprot:XP_018651783.1 putative multidrug resistance protein 1, 2, 3 (p glycoprotein 1, 2, 3) [Schistosoma mansoni]